MELFDTTNNTYKHTKLILQVTGNSRFQILHDYESHLINKTCLYYARNKLYLETTDNNNILNGRQGKYYMQFQYNNGIPTISNVSNVSNYKHSTTISNALTNYAITNTTYDALNIHSALIFDKTEVQKILT